MGIGRRVSDVTLAVSVTVSGCARQSSIVLRSEV